MKRTVCALCSCVMVERDLRLRVFMRSSGINKEVKKVKVQFSRYRPGVAQRVGRGIAVLFHDRGARRG